MRAVRESMAEATGGKVSFEMRRSAVTVVGKWTKKAKFGSGGMTARAMKTVPNTQLSR